MSSSSPVIVSSPVRQSSVGSSPVILGSPNLSPISAAQMNIDSPVILKRASISPADSSGIGSTLPSPFH